MVSIDTVYQRVQALANKEQRGYITPIEFNLFANQAQMDIFEQYFYDRSQFGRLKGNDTIYADPIDILEEKIEIFHKSQNLTNTVGVNNVTINNKNIFSLGDLNSEYYRLASVIYSPSPASDAEYNRSSAVTVEKVTHSKFSMARNSSLTMPTLQYPIYYLKDNRLILNPKEINSIDINYIKKPEKVEWNGYNVGGTFAYNSTDSTDFELHVSEETKLVIKILQLAGIAMKDPSLYQIGAAEDIKNIQQEKQ